MQGALHDHDVFEAGVDGLAHDDAAAEVRPDVGVLDKEVLDGGAVGLGKEARVALGVQDLILVVQALHGMVLTVKDALKGMLFVAKGEVLDRIRNNGVHIIIVKNDIVIEIDAPLRCVALTRQRDKKSFLFVIWNSVCSSACAAAGSTITQQRAIAATATSLPSTPRFLFLISMG